MDTSRIDIRRIAEDLSAACLNYNVVATIGRDPGTNKFVAKETPSGLLLPVDLGPTTRISNFVVLLEDLDHRLQTIAPGLNLEVSRKPLYVEIKRDKDRGSPIHLTAEYLSRLPLGDFQAVVGMAIRLNDSFVPLLDVKDMETPHFLFAGAAGTGKSTAMVAMALSMAYTTSPDKMKIVLIDPKKRSLPPLGLLPHVIGEAYTPEDIGDAVRWAEAEVKSRILNPKNDHVIVIIDETSEVLHMDASVQPSLVSTAKLGRELGVHILSADQRPLASNLGGDYIQQLSGRIVGRLKSSREASDVTGVADPTLQFLHGRGSMVYFPGGRQSIKLQTFLPDIQGIVEATIRKYPKKVDRISMVTEKTVPKAKFDVEADLDAMRPVFVEYYDHEGRKMKRGGYSKAAVAIGSDYGGSTITRVALALELWKDREVGDD